jgi:hypothetical protein
LPFGSEKGIAVREAFMDVLSEVLRVVWLQELFYNAESSSHGVFMRPDQMDWRTTLKLKASGWIAYHLLTEERDSVRLADGDRLAKLLASLG